MKYKAFTLVELIVVITLLWILSTVAFVSYIGYSENSRDSARISNLTKLEKSLEARKAKAGEYPTPDDAIDVTYLGKKIFTQWILGDKTKKHLKFKAEGMDPKYEADYTYSVTADGKRYEMWTIMEDGSNNTLWFFANTYASEDDVALNHGNFNGKYYSTKVNGETHVFTLPSLTLKNKANFEVTVDQTTDNFAVTWVGALPETYSGKSEANWSVDFTPRLLYRGPNCGIETDQEIVNFVATLRDSFNREPFISDPTYASVFSDYDYLRNNIDDFDNLEELWIKINESLGCHIKNFKTTDIFPTQCWYEQLNFEWVEEGFDIETQSCLFEYTWNWSAVVRDNIWVWNTKWLNVNPSWWSGKLSYRVFTYKPTKFKFDITSTELKWTSYIEFYINWNRFIRKESWDDYNLGYETYTTSLLPPGLYDFEWKIFKNSSHNTQLWLDNLDFTCIGWGTWCGWTLGFESWDQDPNEMFRFDGEVNIPWQIVEDATEWSFAIVNPLIPTSKNTSITYVKNLDVPSRLSFDYKIWDHHDWWVRLYIDGIEYKQWGWWSRWDPMQTVYWTYLTPLLQQWTHEIKITVYRNWNTWHKTFMYLDNFQTVCELWDAWCGMNLSFENTDETYPWYFSFNGQTTTPWWLESEPENVTEWEYSMRSPSIPNSSRSNMYYHKDFSEPAKISFDYKLEQAWSWAKFYIDDIEYDYIWYWWRNPGPWFHTFTTPLLTGEHEIKIEIFRNWNSGMWWNYVYLYLDNFQVTCFGWVWVSWNENCGWEEWTFENWLSNPWELYDFTWGIDIPWATATWTGWGLAIKSPKSKVSTHSYMQFDKTLSEWQELKFDLKLKSSCGWSASLKINWIQQVKWWYQWITAPSDYEEYSTGPLWSWTYNFEFDIYRNWNTCSYADFYLDNLRVE